jgi:hypothetical protein
MIKRFTSDIIRTFWKEKIIGMSLQEIKTYPEIDKINWVIDSTLSKSQSTLWDK